MVITLYSAGAKSENRLSSQFILLSVRERWEIAFIKRHNRIFPQVVVFICSSRSVHVRLSVAFFYDVTMVYLLFVSIPLYMLLKLPLLFLLLFMALLSL